MGLPCTSHMRVAACTANTKPRRCSHLESEIIAIERDKPAGRVVVVVRVVAVVAFVVTVVFVVVVVVVGLVVAVVVVVFVVVVLISYVINKFLQEYRNKTVTIASLSSLSEGYFHEL